MCDQPAGREGDLRLFVNAHDGGGSVAPQRLNGLQKTAFTAHALEAFIHAFSAGQPRHFLLQVCAAAVDRHSGAHLQSHLQPAVGQVCHNDLRRTAAPAHGRRHHADGARPQDQHRFAQLDLRAAHRVGGHGQRLDQRTGLVTQIIGQFIHAGGLHHHVIRHGAVPVAVRKADVLTVAVIAVAAGFARAAHNAGFHSDAPAHGNVFHGAAHGLHIAGKLVPDGHRQRRGRMPAPGNVQITSAQGAGAHPHQHLVRGKRGDIPLQKTDFKGFIDLAHPVVNGLHRRPLLFRCGARAPPLRHCTV